MTGNPHDGPPTDPEMACGFVVALVLFALLVVWVVFN